jgi:hypothetical protein
MVFTNKFVNRFTREQIYQLLDYFLIENVTYDRRRRYKPTPEFSICVILYFLAYPSRQYEAQRIFGRSASYLSIVFNTNLRYLNSRYRTILDWHPILTYNGMKSYADKLELASSRTSRIFGFLDGTFREICRPIRDQDLYYSGYYRAHGVKFQAIVAPDGLILSYCGPFMGRVHDVIMYNRSQIPEKLRQIMSHQEPLFLYGDSAYESCYRVITPYKQTRPLLDQEIQFNKALSSDRISVEQAFGKVASQFAANQYKGFHRALLQPIAFYYRISVLLTNCHTIFNGNAISRRYRIEPLSLDEYLIPGTVDLL